MDFVDDWQGDNHAINPVPSQPTVIPIEFVWELSNFCTVGIWIFHWSTNWLYCVRHFARYLFSNKPIDDKINEITVILLQPYNLFSHHFETNDKFALIHCPLP